MIFSSFRFACDFDRPLEISSSVQVPGLGVFARRAYRSGDVLYKSHSQVFFQQPTRESIQIDAHHHLYDSIFAYVNHSCAPNAIFDKKNKQIVALRPIDPNEEITIFYPASESVVKNPFTCLCNQPACIERVRGRQFLALSTSKKMLRAARVPHYGLHVVKTAR